MKLPKKFSLFIFFSLFLATILSVISCRFDLLNAESEKELEEALSNEVHFYSCEEGGAAAPVVITKRFPIGILHNSSDFLSGSELSRLSGGGTFLGYKFYRMTQSGSSALPNYVHENSDGYITNMYVSVDEMDILTDWGVNYTVRH
ncbi:MAG: hypothetical protein K5640_06255, partial [Treponema sp.]|nr:hypothetical protein [Treponema sp.]